MRVLSELEPKNVFSFFEDICNIPHPSYKEDKISNYLVDFAKERKLEYYQDALNNVIIIKEASKGYEDAAPIILQGHMDMVCEKTPDCDKNMDEDDYIRLMTNQHYQCPYYRNGDDYLVVRKQL